MNVFLKLWVQIDAIQSEFEAILINLIKINKYRFGYHELMIVRCSSICCIRKGVGSGERKNTAFFLQSFPQYVIRF